MNWINQSALYTKVSVSNQESAGGGEGSGKYLTPMKSQ